MPQQTPNGPVPVLRNQFRVGAYLKGFPSSKGEEPRHPAVGALFVGASPYTPQRLGTQMASHHPRSSVVTPEALEEARRNVWLVLKAHGWEPEQEIDKDIAQMLIVLAKRGVTDTRELLRLTLEHFELVSRH